MVPFVPVEESLLVSNKNKYSFTLWPEGVNSSNLPWNYTLTSMKKTMYRKLFIAPLSVVVKDWK